MRYDKISKRKNDSIDYIKDLKIKLELEHRIPGMRVFKSFLAIMICVLIDYFRQSASPFQSSIAALICIQPTIYGTFKSSVSRVYGTLLSGLFSALFLTLINHFSISYESFLFYVLVGLFSLILMSIFIYLNRPSALSIGIVVYLVICFTTKNQEPINYTLGRVIDTLVGISVAIFINWLPILNIKTPEVLESEKPLIESIQFKEDIVSPINENTSKKVKGVKINKRELKKTSTVKSFNKNKKYRKIK